MRQRLPPPTAGVLHEDTFHVEWADPVAGHQNDIIIAGREVDDALCIDRDQVSGQVVGSVVGKS